MTSSTSSGIQTAAGVNLSSQQETHVRCVLDLFAGKPTKEKLQQWDDDAAFEDPITKSQGRKQFEAQWFGLPAMFNPIEPLSHVVTSSGNPITIDLKTQYTLKGIKTSTTISSVVTILLSENQDKILKVEDKWNGNLPDNSFVNAFRKLNAVTVPHIVGVPKDDSGAGKA